MINFVTITEFDMEVNVDFALGKICVKIYV